MTVASFANVNITPLVRTVASVYRSTMISRGTAQPQTTHMSVSVSRTENVCLSVCLFFVSYERPQF